MAPRASGGPFSIMFNMTNKEHLLQPDYTLNSPGFQGKVVIDFSNYIPDDDFVRLLDQIGDEMDYTELEATYSKLGRNPGVPPKVMFKTWVYAYSQCRYSSRDVAALCRRDLHAIWLLEGNLPPSHNTFARFRARHLVDGVMDGLFAQLIGLLNELDEVQFKNFFIDGSKFEAYANRYTFVWKKSILHHQGNLFEKIKAFLDDYNSHFRSSLFFSEGKAEECLEQSLKVLDAVVIEIKGIAFVHGKGKRKPPEQKLYEAASEHLSKLREYARWLALVGEGRSSLSKTDLDATFMRLKDDHMKNGQLKPAYNVQLAVESEYIVWAGLFQNANDLNTFVPFMESIRERFDSCMEDLAVTADAGYESEQNYRYLDGRGIVAYIKPANYEQMKTKKFKIQIGRRENMSYDVESDSYICASGNRLVLQGTRRSISKAGYESEVSTYRCENCRGCPLREKCMKSKNPEYNKQVEVSKKFTAYREASHENIISDKGIILRMNRSIQVEGAFGIIKEDAIFRRFFLRGLPKTTAEFFLLAFAFNSRKLHSRIQNKRTGLHLFCPEPEMGHQTVA